MNFFRNVFFFHKCKLCIVWNWFIANYRRNVVLMVTIQNALGLNRGLLSNIC